MILLSLIAALLLEQWHPLSSRKYLAALMRDYAGFIRNLFDGGDARHGRIAWLLAVSVPLVVSVVMYHWLEQISVLLAWVYCVLVLYLTMGFRQFSHYFTDIHKALLSNDLPGAKKILTEWLDISCDEMNEEEVIRLTLERALLATHCNVFAVTFWFVICMFLGLGPAGAIFYRLSRFLTRHWTDEEAFGAFTSRLNYFIEWLPVRMTAITFAIVGNFEDAIYCWRTQSSLWKRLDEGVVIASGAGALGVILGKPVVHCEELHDRAELGVGDAADIHFMQSAVGLVWRALVFWLLLLLLLTVAGMAHWN